MSHNTARQRQELRYPGAPVLDFIYEDEEPNYFIAGILASEPVPDTLRILFRKTFRGYRTSAQSNTSPQWRKGELCQQPNTQSMMLLPKY